MSPSFTPSTEPKYLACTNQKQLFIYGTESWNTHLTLTDAKLKGSFTVCDFSKCGKFVAAGTTKGELAIWTVEGGKRVTGKTESDSDEPITSLAWNPNGLNQFVYADQSGQIGCVNVDLGEANGKTAKGKADGMDVDNGE